MWCDTTDSCKENKLNNNHIMRVVYNKLLKIENETGLASFASFENTVNIDGYVMRILQKCANSPVERRYKLSTVLNTTKDRVTKLIDQVDVDEVSLAMGTHLSVVEQNANQKYAQLKGKIPTGILLIALADMETDGNDHKLIIIKCDYDEFIAEGTGQQSSGLSVKNQIFKTCQYNIKINDDSFVWGEITASDSTKRCASYWHSEFLELEEQISDDENTKNAYETIKRKILNPLKKDHKPDYWILYNNTIAYMRRTGTFDLDEYKNNIIGAYTPYDNTLKIDDLKDKVEKLRSLNKFDATFTKVPSVITDRVKDLIKLTDELELKVKHNINGMENVIMKYEGNDGRKGITIISQNGYDYAKGLQRQ